MKFVRVMCVW